MDEAKLEETSLEEEQLQDLIGTISSYIEQYHGGSVEVVALEGRVLKVRMAGACEGCPLSPNTLQGWVQGTVSQFFPDILVVEADS